MPQRASGAFLICHKRKAANVDGGRARGLGIPVGGPLLRQGEQNRILPRNLSSGLARVTATPKLKLKAQRSLPRVAHWALRPFSRLGHPKQ